MSRRNVKIRSDEMFLSYIHEFDDENNCAEFVLAGDMKEMRVTLNGKRKHAKYHMWRIVYGDFPDYSLKNICGNTFCVKTGHHVLATNSNRLFYGSSLNDVTGCWEWLGASMFGGYGRIKVYGKVVSTHRLSWETFYGKIPGGMLVCHHCDNPSCVNPEHLFLGTHKDNTQDSVYKNRRFIPSGESHGRSKLSVDEVLKIKSLNKNQAISHGKLAKMFGVTKSTITSILVGRTWSCV